MLKNEKSNLVHTSVQDGTPEVKLLRLLQDDEKWDTHSLKSVQILLNLLQLINKEQVSKEHEKVERNETKSLIKLQNWLKNHNKVSGVSSDDQNWQLCNEDSVSTGLQSDFRGNR